ncbi:hypothetical protein, partial [Iningainema tapete]|uniref:hypothetical protein n=1 Tax=Iningainema tapete TaxID=2806730 RepID=UPI001EE21FB5
SVEPIIPIFCSSALKSLSILKFRIAVLAYGCHWVRDYLRTNPEVEESETPELLRDRHLCDGVQDLTREFPFRVLN